MSYYLQCGWEIFRQKCNEPVLSWQMNLLACVFLNPGTTKCYLTIKAYKRKKTEAEYTRNWVPANQDQEMAATAQRTSRSCVIECGPSSVGCSMGCLPSALPFSPHIYTANGFCFPLSKSFSVLWSCGHSSCHQHLHRAMDLDADNKSVSSAYTRRVHLCSHCL